MQPIQSGHPRTIETEAIESGARVDERQRIGDDASHRLRALARNRFIRFLVDGAVNTAFGYLAFAADTALGLDEPGFQR